MSLSRRFGRVATRFGMGLRNAIKGSVIGLSLAFLTKLLNPLNELHDRIKKLLGETDDIRETAAKYGTTPGELMYHETRAQYLGVKPEIFVNLLESFRKAVEQRRTEVDEGTRTTLGKDPLLFQANTLAGFQRALTLIDAFKETDPVQARAFQRELFGETLTGSQLKLLDSSRTVTPLGNPYDAITRANEATGAVGKQADIFRMMSAVQDFEDRLRSSRAISGEVTTGVLMSQQKELDKQFAELQNFRTLQSAAEGVGAVMELLTAIRDGLLAIVAWLNDHGLWIKDFLKWIKPFFSAMGARK